MFALMGVSIKSLRLRRELSPDVSFSKEVMYSASYSIIRGGTFISLPPKRKRDLLFFERTAADKDASMQQILPLLSPTFKYTAEIPKLVSVWSKVTGGRELSSETRYDLCLLQMQVFNDYKGSTGVTAGRLKLIK